jgi:signal transduction histidine kinase
VTLTQDGKEAVLEVADNGIGIASDMLPAIFRVFVQVDKASGGSDRGLGVGLAVVSRLVEEAGGSVVASSPGLGHGSTFSVRLPVSRSQ